MEMPNLEEVCLDTPEEAIKVFEDITQYLFSDEDYFINGEYADFIHKIYSKFENSIDIIKG